MAFNTLFTFAEALLFLVVLFGSHKNVGSLNNASSDLKLEVNDVSANVIFLYICGYLIF